MSFASPPKTVIIHTTPDNQHIFITTNDYSHLDGCILNSICQDPDELEKLDDLRDLLYTSEGNLRMAERDTADANHAIRAGAFLILTHEL